MSLKLPYFHVDAFAERPFTGNQAAVMPLERWLVSDRAFQHARQSTERYLNES